VTKVSDALTSRRSVRAYLDTPVDKATIRRVIEHAGRAPSGGNLQPWRIYALTGEPLDRLKTLIDQRTAETPRGEGAEYDVYPKELATPYAERRFAVGEMMYERLGIPRNDREARRRWFARNYRFFEAPVGLFCFVERYMGPPQWSDLGMYLQSLMLLLREEGLDSCAQECWALFPKTVSDFVDAPPGLMLFCGMAVGYGDLEHDVNAWPVPRAHPNEFATFLGFED
jgi:nitroreductase